MSMIEEIRRKAMSAEGISDAEMQDFQDRQAALMKVAERDGGPEAIRAAMKPRAKPKAKAKTRPIPSGTPDPQWLKDQQARKMSEEEALGERNFAALSGNARPMPEGTPDPQWLIDQLQEKRAAEAPPEAMAPEQGMIAKLMQLLSGGQQAAPSNPWQGPKGMQGALPAAMNPAQRLLGR